ncbi:MAG: nucleotidyl transferase AbiEii/AbiGii toxin family protein [Burkholderiales bacterium]|nr:nucleotidyl transferase AbiEii/AbiGii toxin family protein [Bacteroidia bacterium]
MLSKYTIETTTDYTNATREVMQEIALAGLYRGGFFDVAAFYGGTCLRIFYGLERFSEDLDFSLLIPNRAFSLQPYFKAIETEFNALGIEIEIIEKNKSTHTSIESAFLKQTIPIYHINFDKNKNIKIKFEIDTNPPLGFETENKLLLQPFSYFVNTYSLPDLFAGKMHALLFRSWRNRVKGRDWFDFEWYIKNNVKLNLNHFSERAFQSKHLPNQTITKNEFVTLLKNKVNSTDIDLAKADVINFIKEKKSLDIWSTNYFLQIADLLKFI